MGSAAVRESDRLHDREPEAAALGSCRIGTAEALERAGYERLGKAAALIEHMQLHGVVALTRCQRHLAAAMAKSVVEHVRQRLLDPEWIDAGDEVLGVHPGTETHRNSVREVRKV